MKRIVFLFLAAVLTANYAQAQVSFGVRAGWANTGNGQFGGIFDTDNEALGKDGFQIGGIADLKLSKAFSIQPGLLLATQGDKFVKKEYKSLLKNDKVTIKVNMTYIQVPVHAIYKIHLAESDGKNVSLLIHAGPYFGYAIGGKFKYKLEIGGKTNKEKEDIKFGDGEEYHYKPIDFGLGTGVGLQAANIRVDIGYNHGLLDISNSLVNIGSLNIPISPPARNWSFVVGVTYLFGK